MTTYKTGKDYTIDWTEDIATVTWDDGLIQTIALMPRDVQLLEAGHDPVEEMWEDGIGNAVCRENATPEGTDGVLQVSRDIRKHIYEGDE